MKEHELIVTIINKDFADEAMDAARKGGAKGGTILTARGKGICFSLPVDNVLGASWLPDEETETNKPD